MKLEAIPVPHFQLNEFLYFQSRTFLSYVHLFCRSRTPYLFQTTNYLQILKPAFPWLLPPIIYRKGKKISKYFPLNSFQRHRILHGDAKLLQWEMRVTSALMTGGYLIHKVTLLFSSTSKSCDIEPRYKTQPCGIQLTQKQLNMFSTFSFRIYLTCIGLTKDDNNGSSFSCKRF